MNDLKLLIGTQLGSDWGGILYPNITNKNVYKTELKCIPGCIYNVTNDPLELHNIYKEDLFSYLNSILIKEAKTIWYRPYTRADPECLLVAKNKWSGFLGPYRENV